MITLLSIISGVVFLVIFIALVWRFISNRHSLPCPTWLAWLVELDNPFFKSNRAREIISHLDLHSGMKVLDMGCGPGRLTIPIAKQIAPGGEVIAMDIQPGMLSRAGEKAEAENLKNIRFILGGPGEGKIGKHKYDRVLLVTVLGEISERENALKEIFENLKPGGFLSITEIIADPHFQGYNKVLKLAENAGFKEKNFFGNRWAYTIHLEKPL